MTHSLSRAELNGYIGTIVSYNASRMRYVFRLDGRDVDILLKSCNVRPASKAKGSANDPQNVDACAICLEPLATDMLPLLVQA